MIRHDTFPAVTTAPHRPLMGAKPRAVLSSCTVDAKTLSTLKGWKRHAPSMGITLDRVVAHAVRTHFNPKQP